MIRSVEEICEFLSENNVDRATVLRFRQNRIDSQAVSVLSPDQISSLGLVALGDRVKLFAFCGQSTLIAESPQQETPDIYQSNPSTIIDKRKRLLSQLRKGKQAEGATSCAKSCKSGRPKKTARIINIGLRLLESEELDNEGCRKAVTIKAPLGDKNCIAIELCLDITYDLLKKEIVEAFFINGNNPIIGDISEYNCEVVNGRNKQVNKELQTTFTLGNYIREKKIPGAIRVYLLCCPLSLSQEDDIEEDLPEGFEFASPSGEVMIRHNVNLSTTSSLHPPTCTAVPIPPVASTSASHSHLNYGDILVISDSEEELEVAIAESLREAAQQHETQSCLSESEVLRMITAKISPENRPNLINVIRGRVIDGAARAIKRASFDPHCPLSIKFMDDIGIAEGAVDEGGPKREFFTLFMREFEAGPMLSGPTGQKFIALSYSAAEKDYYYIAGVLITLSLAHGCTPPFMFSNKMYKWISEGYLATKADMELEDVTDSDLLIKLKQVKDARTLEELQTASEEIEGIMQLAGCVTYVRGIEEKDKIVRACTQFHVMERVRSCMERFLAGLSTLGVLDLLRQNKTAFRCMFSIDGKQTLTRPDIEVLFPPCLAVQGSNRRRQQLLSLSFWNDFLVDVEEKTSSVTFPQLLMFATGADSKPPLGFDPSPKLEFLPPDEHEGYPRANTCSNTLKLPVIYNEYDIFKEKLEFGILNSAGFGLP